MRDDFGIEAHIMSATKEIGALNNFWYNPHIDNYSKYLIFQAILMNLLLLGCEAWLLLKTIKSKIEVLTSPPKTDIENLYVPSEI